jgi:hypothetical protein
MEFQRQRRLPEIRVSAEVTNSSVLQARHAAAAHTVKILKSAAENDFSGWMASERISSSAPVSGLKLLSSEPNETDFPAAAEPASLDALNAKKDAGRKGHGEIQSQM